MNYQNKRKREELILQRRKSLRSQMDVAFELGISQGHYWGIENGYVNPGEELAAKIVAMFKLPTDYFDQKE